MRGTRLVVQLGHCSGLTSLSLIRSLTVPASEFATSAVRGSYAALQNSTADFERFSNLKRA